MRTTLDDVTNHDVAFHIQVSSSPLGSESAASLARSIRQKDLGSEELAQIAESLAGPADESPPFRLVLPELGLDLLKFIS